MRLQPIGQNILSDPSTRISQSAICGDETIYVFTFVFVRCVCARQFRWFAFGLAT